MSSGLLRNSRDLSESKEKPRELKRLVPSTVSSVKGFINWCVLPGGLIVAVIKKSSDIIIARGYLMRNSIHGLK
jgi:hypothetical protein